METFKNWVSLREFARKREVRLSAVQKAIESGRVTAVKRDPKGRLIGIEMNLATAQWNGNTDVDQAGRAGKTIEAPNTLLGATHPGGGDNAAGAAPADEPTAVAAPVNTDQHGYHEAKAALTREQLKRASIDNLERSGELTPARDVREEIFNALRQVRDQMILLPRNLSLKLAAENDPSRCEQMIDEAVTKVLNDCARTLRVNSTAGGTTERASAGL